MLFLLMVLLEANKTSFGVRALPMYRFDKAAVIVSFGADLLVIGGTQTMKKIML